MMVLKFTISSISSIKQYQFLPNTEELLFGIITNSPGDNATKKFNYTTLFMRYYIYTSTLNSKPISLLDFIDAVKQRYILENSFY